MGSGSFVLHDSFVGASLYRANQLEMEMRHIQKQFVLTHPPFLGDHATLCNHRYSLHRPLNSYCSFLIASCPIFASFVLPSSVFLLPVLDLSGLRVRRNHLA